MDDESEYGLQVGVLAEDGDGERKVVIYNLHEMDVREGGEDNKNSKASRKIDGNSNYSRIKSIDGSNKMYRIGSREAEGFLVNASRIAGRQDNAYSSIRNSWMIDRQSTQSIAT